jgi:transcriptional regulator with XRE-family HTH domain
MNLGNAIKSLRKEMKISRKELASRSQISVTALHNIENSLSFPSKDTINGICSALGVPVSYLVFYQVFT